MRPRLVYIALAAGIAAGGLTYLVMSSTPPSDASASIAIPAPSPAPARAVAPEAALQASAAASGVAPRPTAVPAAAPEPAVNGDPTPDLSSYVNPGEKPSMNEVIARLHQAGVETGLGAFSPPGTRPPLIGLAVPENFVLPPGFVRHHQATDDGQRIEAILMFAPDREFFDGANGPVKIPKDRVVPPELAPPGLPIRRIVVPAPSAAAGPGS
jgi:hypothetical protein